MALNSSGPISLAGSTAGQSIALELSQSATGTISLNDAAVRNLAGVPSGAITMPTNFWGKSSLAGYYGVYQNTYSTDQRFSYVQGGNFIDASNNCTVGTIGTDAVGNGLMRSQIYLSSNFTLSTTFYGFSAGSYYTQLGAWSPIAKPYNTTSDHGCTITIMQSDATTALVLGWGTNFTYNSTTPTINYKSFPSQNHPNPISPYTNPTALFTVGLSGTTRQTAINTAGTQGAATGAFFNYNYAYNPSTGKYQNYYVNYRWFIATFNSSYTHNLVYCTNTGPNSASIYGTQDTLYGIVYDTSGNIFTIIQAYTDVDGYNTRFALLKFNSSLTLQWQKKLDNSGSPVSGGGYSVLGTDSSGHVYIMNPSGGAAPFQFTVTKVDGSNGSVLWSKYYNLSYSSGSAYGPVGSINNDILIVGTGSYLDYVGSTTRLLRINISDGSLIWERQVGMTNAFGSYYYTYYPLAITNNGTNYLLSTLNSYGQSGMPYPGNMTVLRMPVSGAVGSGTSTGGVINTFYQTSATTTVTNGNMALTTSGFSFATWSFSGFSPVTVNPNSASVSQYSKATF